MWLGPPYMNRKMTDLALGAKCGGLAAKWVAVLRFRSIGLGEEAVARQHRSEGRRTETTAGLPEELATGASAKAVSFSIRSHEVHSVIMEHKDAARALLSQSTNKNSFQFNHSQAVQFHGRLRWSPALSAAFRSNHGPPRSLRSVAVRDNDRRDRPSHHFGVVDLLGVDRGGQACSPARE